ncbi:hypothetical protein OIO90_003311 [Microbotryomycetes sp. JL221]|nr:hypothetical protein OIO90_003311 [Microbotryomycetes sp. JL221]
MPTASTSTATNMVTRTLKQTIPKYKPSGSTQRLPPARMALFRSIVAHPPSPFSVEQVKQSKSKGANQTNIQTTPSGPQQIIFTTSPKPFIPLTNSPNNHKLWNPPKINSKQNRSIEKDESGRLNKFVNKFNNSRPQQREREQQNQTRTESTHQDRGQFDIESDLSFLEGTTLQSPGTALGKRDIV